MGQPRKRPKAARGPSRLSVVLGVAAALALAVLAGYALLSAGGPGRSPRSEDPGHAEIDDASKQQLIEILREDEEHTR